MADTGTSSDIDPIEAPLDPVGVSAVRVQGHWRFRRLALGLSPTPRSGLVLLVVGAALGPYGLGILSDSVLATMDPAVSVAIATIGVAIGLDLALRRSEGRLLGAGSLEAAVTVAIVAAGIAVVLLAAPVEGATPWLLALMIGVCAAPSSTAADPLDDHGRTLATRIGDLDDVLPILLGVIAIAWAQPGTAVALTWVVIQGGLIAVSIAFASWLLVTQTSSEGEQRVFVLGALLLLGGAAAHLQLSALLAGFIGGLFWGGIGGAVFDQVARDVRYLQRPLIVLLLVVAGARVALSVGVAILVVAYIGLRVLGKFAGGRSAARLARDLPRDVGFSWSAPGVVGIAIALTLLQAGIESSITVCAVVVTGTLGSELVSLFFHPGQDVRS